MPNYRQQTTTSLGTSTACPSCTPTFSQLTLCFATTENTLCCGTSTQSIVYVGYQANPTLANVTGLLYSNNTLTTQATAGFYSDDAGITCTTPPTGISYTLQNGTQSDLTYSYTNTSGGVVSGFLGGFEGQTICAQANSVSADTGITISTGSSC